jgi:hypothetical protein
MARNIAKRVPQFKEVHIDRNVATRKAGLGWVAGRGLQGEQRKEDIKRFVGRLTQQLASPTYNLPTIESVRIHYDGPLSPADVQGSFGAKIDPFGCNIMNPPAGAESVDSTFVEPGKFQTFALICAIGFQVEPIPWVWSVTGNAAQFPETAATKPFSPDVFTAADTATSTLIPAIVEFGQWQERAFYHMVRAYNLRWQMGSRTNIVDDSLRYTAYMPSNAQDGSASNSMVATGYDINQGNQYYQGVLGSPYGFLTMDRIRVGGIGATAPGPAGSSSFRPYRNDLVPATFGGAGLRAYLKGNGDFRKMTVPYLMKPGVPIGLYAEVSNTDEQAMMQAWFSATYDLGGAIPAQFTDSQLWAAGAGTAANELQLDNTVVAETILSQRMYFKFGPFKICQAVKGFELTDDQADALQGVDLSTALMNECGVQMSGGGT